jgi:hypothetical protein
MFHAVKHFTNNQFFENMNVDSLCDTETLNESNLATIEDLTVAKLF